MKITLSARKERGSLATQLLEAGVALDTRCGGRGTCGRCQVKLLSGDWRVDGAKVQVPSTVPACRTTLLSDVGEVDVPESSRVGGKGRISDEWQLDKRLPDTSETVVAIDLGTTTIVAIKIRGGVVVGKASCFNPQRIYGDNVITRISHAASGKLAELHHIVLDAINSLLLELDARDAERIALAGNTVMSCLLHGINPESIGVLPFTPPLRRFPEVDCFFGTIPVKTMPAISGYVGGDLTAGFAETALAEGEMLIDIGTNCEMIYYSKSGVFCAAAAAGPAFEGAGISCGCRAVEGAIDHFYDDGTFSIIGNGGGAPIGFCGSAMVDFIAVNRRAGRINEVGRYEPAAKSQHVAEGIAVGEGDIEQILKAKAAVCAGIKTLEDHCGVPARKIYLAGGFAQYLNLENAFEIGMLPRRTCEVVGNTSLAGAAHLACAPESIGDFEKLSDIPHEIPLNTLPEFEDNYIDGLLL